MFVSGVTCFIRRAASKQLGGQSGGYLEWPGAEPDRLTSRYGTRIVTEQDAERMLRLGNPALEFRNGRFCYCELDLRLIDVDFRLCSLLESGSHDSQSVVSA